MLDFELDLITEEDKEASSRRYWRVFANEGEQRIVNTRNSIRWRAKRCTYVKRQLEAAYAALCCFRMRHACALKYNVGVAYDTMCLFGTKT